MSITIYVNLVVAFKTKKQNVESAIKCFISAKIFKENCEYIPLANLT